MQLEQEYEEKQVVLHEKHDLEGLIGTLCDQVRHTQWDIWGFHEIAVCMRKLATWREPLVFRKGRGQTFELASPCVPKVHAALLTLPVGSLKLSGAAGDQRDSQKNTGK